MLRAFADLPDRQVHFRHAGAAGVPLLMLHAAPGSSRTLDRLGDSLAATRRVLATDRPGSGDSPALPLAAPEIADFARAEFAFLDSLGLNRVDIYGAHTGACVAIEMAIQAPTRARRLVLDGVGLFSDAEVAAYLHAYAPAMQPDLAGTHLAWAFQFCRDQMLFFPWFDRRRETARGLGLLSAQALHASVLDVLKSLETYHLGYHASFRYPSRARLPLLSQPVLAIAASDDPLHAHLQEALRLIPNAVTDKIGPLRAADSVAKLADTIDHFLKPSPPTAGVEGHGSEGSE
jgi:pimeloyl-ACP methyl ester carboxylesterase